jgi:hypothetical protein
MTISISKDVSVKYNETEITNYSNKNNLVFFDDLSNTTQDKEFATNIFTLGNLQNIVNSANNPTALDFFNTFFGQKIRPSSYVFCAAQGKDTPGFLITTLSDWDDFKKLFNDPHIPALKTPLIFQVTTKNNLNIYKINGEQLRKCNNYSELVNLLAPQNTANINLSYNADNNTLSFYTKATGPADGKISYLSYDNNLTIDSPAQIYCEDAGSFDVFKQALADAGIHQLGLSVTDNAGNLIYAYVNIASDGFNSWQDLANAFNVTTNLVRIDVLNETHLLFTRTAVGAASTITYLSGGTQIGDSRFEILIKGTQASGATLIQGGAKASVVDAASALNGLQNSPNVKKEDGKTNIMTQAQYMEAFKKVLSDNNITPNAIVISRNLNVNEQKLTDIDTTKNFINGFFQYFSYASEAPTCALLIGSNVYQIESAEGEMVNPFGEFVRTPKSLSLILNYNRNISEYLDGAVAAYITGINFESTTPIARSLKGLTFNNVTPDKLIDDALDKQLSVFHFNFYGIMDDNSYQYRYGMTCSTGDVGYIDTIMCINAIIIDIRTKLNAIISKGILAINSTGSTLINSLLSQVCNKYVVNGFLSEVSYKDSDNKVTVLPAYKVVVPFSFTIDQMTSKNFPGCSLYLNSTNFSSTIEISVSSIISTL